MRPPSVGHPGDRSLATPPRCKLDDQAPVRLIDQPATVAPVAAGTDHDGNAWIRAVVFDLDGLLVDSEPLWHRAEIEVFGRVGVHLTTDMCRSTKGWFVGDVAQLWFDRIGWDGPSPEAVAGQVVDEMEELMATEVELKPGAQAAVSWCHRHRLPAAVATSSSHRLIDAALGRHRLGDAFVATCSADDVGVGKPDPAVFLAAARAVGVAPERCLALEDSAIGAQAAMAAAMGCVLVPESGARSPGVVVDVVMGSLVELPEAWPRIDRAVRARLGTAQRGSRSHQH